MEAPRLRSFARVALMLGALASWCVGCSGGEPAAVGQAGSRAAVATVPLVSEEAALAEALVQNVDLALSFSPTSHLNPQARSKQAAAGGSLTIPVSALQANYETTFCQLSTSLGVTLSTPQSVAKIDFMKRQTLAGNFDLLARPIANNAAGVNMVEFRPISFQTTVDLPTGPRTFSVSGGLLMPRGIGKEALRGVIVDFHGTTFDKQMVGSNYVTNPETQLASQVFASQGYVVLIPDYVGQGVDWRDVHPYVLYPEVSAKTAVDMLTAVKSTLVETYSLAGGDPPLPLFSTGYSEGGAYALWFNTYIRSTPQVLDPMYALTHSVGIEGAYRTSSVVKPYLFGNVAASGGNLFNIQTQGLVNAVKPVLAADALLSYATYSQGSRFADVFNMDYFDLECGFLIPQSDCDVNGQNLTIAQAFAQESVMVAKPLLFAAFGKHANGSTYPGRLEMTTSSQNSVNPLVSPMLLTTGGQSALDAALLAADVDLSGVPDGAVSIVTLGQDSVVSPNNFDALAAAYPTKLRNAIKIDPTSLMVLSPLSRFLGKAMFVPVDHMHGLVYEYLYALHIFNGFVQPSKTTRSEGLRGGV